MTRGKKNGERGGKRGEKRTRAQRERAVGDTKSERRVGERKDDELYQNNHDLIAIDDDHFNASYLYCVCRGTRPWSDMRYATNNKQSSGAFSIQSTHVPK